MPRNTKNLNQSPSVYEYHGFSDKAFCAAVRCDFSETIKTGDLLTVEPDLTPIPGDIVLTKRAGKTLIDVYYPAPKLSLVPKGANARTWKLETDTYNSQTDEIVGVVVAHTKPTVVRQRLAAG